MTLLCKDCEYADKGAVVNKPLLWLCKAPQNSDAPSMVDGKPRVKYEFCSNARDANDGCSNAAKWFKEAVGNVPA